MVDNLEIKSSEWFFPSLSENERRHRSARWHKDGITIIRRDSCQMIRRSKDCLCQRIEQTMITWTDGILMACPSHTHTYIHTHIYIFFFLSVENNNINNNKKEKKTWIYHGRERKFPFHWLIPSRTNLWVTFKSSSSTASGGWGET